MGKIWGWNYKLPIWKIYVHSAEGKKGISISYFLLSNIGSWCHGFHSSISQMLCIFIWQWIYFTEKICIMEASYDRCSVRRSLSMSKLCPSPFATQWYLSFYLLRKNIFFLKIKRKAWQTKSVTDNIAKANKHFFFFRNINKMKGIYGNQRRRKKGGGRGG